MGLYTVVVDAYARFLGADWPYFTLYADGQAVSGSVPVNTSNPEQIAFALNLTDGVAHSIQIVAPTPDSSAQTLTVQDILLSNQTISAQSALETYSSSHGTVTGSGDMTFGGQIGFDLPAALFGGSNSPGVPVVAPTTPTPAQTSTAVGNDTIVVNAEATLAGGIGAHFSVNVDGVKVGEAVAGAVQQAYGFNATLTAGQAHDIQIIYDNDAVINGQDRNLLLQSIAINGQTVSATDSREVYHAPLNPGPGDLVGNGNMNWNGTAEFSLPASFFAAPAPAPVPTPTPVPTNAIVVGGGSQYTTIQQGVTAAEQAGVHTVLVNPGAYQENATLTGSDNGLSVSAPSGGVTLSGSISISAASDITVSGLTFNGNGSNVAVVTQNSQRLTITDDTFTGTGQAVTLDGTGGTSITNNLMTNTTNSAIEAFNGANGNIMDSNVINGDSAPDTKGAIWLHGSNNDAITHNQLTNTAGAGISLGDFYGPGRSATQNDNNTIAYNSLNQVDTQSQDSGAIYILGRSQNPLTNDTVTMNFVGTTGSTGAHAVGIYLDDNASGVQVTQNIVRATPAMSDAFQVHGGSNNTFSGNIFDLGTGNTSFGLLQQDDANVGPQGSFAQLQNDVVTGNVFATESASSRNPGFADLTGGIGGVSISENDFWTFSGAAMNIGGSGPRGDSAPVFAPPASGAALATGASAAQATGDYASWTGGSSSFHPIDTSQIGLAPAGPHPY
jgi:hypothetical protein